MIQSSPEQRGHNIVRPGVERAQWRNIVSVAWNVPPVRDTAAEGRTQEQQQSNAASSLPLRVAVLLETQSGINHHFLPIQCSSANRAIDNGSMELMELSSNSRNGPTYCAVLAVGCSSLWWSSCTAAVGLSCLPGRERESQGKAFYLE